MFCRVLEISVVEREEKVRTWGLTDRLYTPGLVHMKLLEEQIVLKLYPCMNLLPLPFQVVGTSRMPLIQYPGNASGAS